VVGRCLHCTVQGLDAFQLYLIVSILTVQILNIWWVDLNVQSWVTGEQGPEPSAHARCCCGTSALRIDNRSPSFGEGSVLVKSDTLVCWGLD
jgi:hypothetical protein